ncbi:MAG TPA: hypothetical protein PLZ08_09400, partial [Bacillota bacterium]|nr:hypothetical protein [Bacillota bacterium]HOL10452.1 hypothetical protein [Bacillota bacterium]HPO98153.1 hypothetical protein [Bacillota bacterium]
MKRRLGEILVDSGLLSVDELQRVLEIQQKRKMPLGKLVVELNLLTEHQISEALSEQTGFPYINLSNYAINPDAANSIPGKIAERFAMVPFDFKENRLLVAAADPLNLEGLDVIRQISKRELEIYFATEDDIQFIVNRFYGQKRLDDNAKLLKNNSENEPEADETILISEDV